MPGPALSAQVMLVCRSASWDGPPGPHTPRTLEQVHFIYHTEEPAGFPYETEMWLFVRLAHARPRPFTRDLFLSLIWDDHPQLRPVVWTRRFQTATFRPDATVRDIAGPMPLVFEGPGHYQFRLWYPVFRKWDRARRRLALGRTFIRVEG